MRIARVAGVKISVNGFVVALLGLCLYAGYLQEALTVLAFVLLHEATHAAVALAYGMVPEEIELLPFGGIARMRGLVELHPEAEAAIAVAGPLNSLAIAGIAKLLLDYGFVQGELAQLVIVSNFSMGVFNLLPLLPLDGGRIVRSFLARRRGFVDATRRMATLSMAAAGALTALAGWAWYSGYPGLLPMVAFAFVGVGAWKEARGAHIALMRYLIVKRDELLRAGILPVDYLLVQKDVPLRDVVRRIAPRRYHIFLLTQDGGVLSGQLTEFDVIEALMTTGPGGSIGQVRQRD